MPYRSVGLTLVTVLAVVGARSAAAAENAGLYKVAKGPHTVEALPKLVLHDGKRDKDLQLRITYPKAGGPFPVIVWSHGAFGSKDAYQPLVRHWASHGYVCIQASHSESVALTGRFTGVRNPQAFRDWRNRPLDVRFIIDSLLTIERRVPALKGRMNTKAIGVGGHSYGAFTAQLVGGVTTRRFRPGQAQERHDDPRPKAFLLISPQGTGGLFTPESYKGLTRPAMIVTGTKDTSPRNDKPYTWRLEVFKHSPPGDKVLVLIKDAWHGFGGIAGRVRFPSSGPMNANHVNTVLAASMALWDAYLKSDRKAAKYLKSDALAKAGRGNVQTKRK